MAGRLAAPRIDLGQPRLRPRAIARRKPRSLPGQREEQRARQRHRHVERAPDRVAQLGQLGAEHDAHDHVERQRLHARVGGERRRRAASARPRPPRARAIRSRCARMRVAVERRQHQLALAQVLGAVEDQDRARARRTARGSSSSRRRGRTSAGAVNTRAHVGGVGDDDHRRVGPRRAERERLAVAGGAAAQQRRRPREPLPGLEGGRGGRAGRQHRRRRYDVRTSAGRSAVVPRRMTTEPRPWAPSSGSACPAVSAPRRTTRRRAAGCRSPRIALVKPAASRGCMEGPFGTAITGVSVTRVTISPSMLVWRLWTHPPPAISP